MKARILAPLILLSAFVSSGFATEVYVNDPIITGITPVANTTVFGATYRVENGGGNGDQTLGLTEAATALAGPYLGRNLGNRTQLTGITWNFELEHLTGQGIVFTLYRTEASTLVQEIIGWGTFAPALPAGSTVDPTLPNPGGTLTPEQPYNAINIRVDTGLNGSDINTVTIANLALSSPTLTLSGGSVLFPGMAGSNGTDALQQILINGDFSQEDWTLTGTVNIVKSNNGCPECAVFAITGSTVEADFPTAIPEPTSFGYAAGGLLLLLIGSLGRRR